MRRLVFVASLRNTFHRPIASFPVVTNGSEGSFSSTSCWSYCGRSFSTSRLPNLSTSKSLSRGDIPPKWNVVDYKSALELLNQLPTNVSAIVDMEKRKNDRSHNLENIQHHLSLLGITDRDLNRLNVIHVAGTKGKGSTCAYVESILRQNGFRTGFFSSPHLVLPRERIRLDGQMISEQKFAEYVHHVFYTLKENSKIPLPAYFSFFCTMAFYVFVRERVDVAIIEVGIGGEHDSTNVVQRPVCTGITSLDLDHCNVLGETIDQIAWHKGGIIKRGVPSFTVKQKPEAIQVLQNRADEKDSPLFVVPQWSLYPYANHIKLGIKGEVQKINASLAVQLAHYWISKRKDPMHLVTKLLTSQGTFADVIPLKKNDYLIGLENTKWYGRCEVVQAGKITYYLDGAHTNDSMESCVEWFAGESHVFRKTYLPPEYDRSPEVNGSNGKHQQNNVSSVISKHLQHSDGSIAPRLVYDKKAFRVLVYNSTGHRDVLLLMSKLKDINFDLIIFTTNFVTKKVGDDERLERERQVAANNMSLWKSFGTKTPISRVDCITNAVRLIESYETKVDTPIHVLVTGSVYLVGGFISLIHPEFMKTSTNF